VSKRSSGQLNALDRNVDAADRRSVQLDGSYERESIASVADPAPCAARFFSELDQSIAGDIPKIHASERNVERSKHHGLRSSDGFANLSKFIEMQIPSCVAARDMSVELGAQTGTPSDVNAIKSVRRSGSRQISCAAARPVASRASVGFRSMSRTKPEANRIRPLAAMVLGLTRQTTPRSLKWQAGPTDQDLLRVGNCQIHSCCVVNAGLRRLGSMSPGRRAREAGLEGVSRKPRTCSKQRGGFVRCIPASPPGSVGLQLPATSRLDHRNCSRSRIVALSVHSK
jgi:hypothetical protein